jgi:SAM-dependent methyltransferase
MKLHELVALRNLLRESIVLDDIKSATEILLQRINIVLETSLIDSGIADPIKSVRNYYASILNILDTPPRDLSAVLSEIESQISDLTAGFDRRGYMINGFYASNATDVSGERNLRTIAVSDSLKQFVRNRISLYSDWKYPGLEIGPGDGFWTSSLVASDPLYIIDNHQEFLDSTKSQFDEAYQNRLRSYVIDYRTNDITALPTGQIGFAFAWNVFNFFPYQELRNYLVQIFDLLRPGGTLMFNYNNCDDPLQARHAEEGWMSWMPKSQLTKLLTELGYEIIAFQEPAISVSAVEVRKPGTLQTVKAHQVLGEIKSVSN